MQSIFRPAARRKTLGKLARNDLTGIS